MRTIRLLTLAGLSSLVLLSACRDRALEGNGHIVAESREVPAFSGVAVSDRLRAEITEGPPSLTLELDENIIGLVHTHVEGNVLFIEPSDDDLDLEPSDH